MSKPIESGFIPQIDILGEPDIVDKYEDLGYDQAAINELITGTVFDAAVTFVATSPDTKPDDMHEKLSRTTAVVRSVGGPLTAKAVMIPPNPATELNAALRSTVGEYWKARGLAVVYSPQVS